MCQAFLALEEFAAFLVSTKRILVPLPPRTRAHHGQPEANSEEEEDDEEYEDDDEEEDEEDAFELPPFTFDGIGTKAGQEEFIRRLLHEVDPAAPVLRALKWPRRARFGQMSIIRGPML